MTIVANEYIHRNDGVDCSDFAQRLLDPALPCPNDLITWNGSDPLKRYSVYRNNVMVSLIDALGDTFPVVSALVGDDFFRAMAGHFVRAQPPRSRVLTWYGEEFPDYIDTFAPAASVPYLADVGRLEMARVRAYHAADLGAIDPAALQTGLTDDEAMSRLVLELHPSVQVITSPHAVFSIWAAHQGALDLGSVNPAKSEAALVFRKGLDVEVTLIRVEQADFIRQLCAGRSLSEAIQSVDSSEAPDNTFDLIGTLAMLISSQLICTPATPSAA